VKIGFAQPAVIQGQPPEVGIGHGFAQAVTHAAAKLERAQIKLVGAGMFAIGTG